jgi:sigma-B regulation protein RsbU (phosphoserine phosphatase)
MCESPASIQLIGFEPEQIVLFRRLLADHALLVSEAASEIQPFKYFGVYIVRVVCDADVQLIKALSDSDGYFLVISVYEQADPSRILESLRAGADDVFFLASLLEEHNAFILAIELLLRRCRLIYEGRVYRETLEASLKELKNDQEAAYQVQSRLLPPHKQVIKDVEFVYSVTPSLIVSGDFIDVVPINEQLTLFYIADVSGHGAASALITILLKNITSRLLRNFKRSSSYDILSPVRTLERINKEVNSLALDKHLTAFCGVINHQENTLNYAVAGHHPMPLYKSAGEVTVLPGRGMPLGLFEEAIFGEGQQVLDDDFSLTLCSDGVLELLSGRSMADKEQQLLNWLETNPPCHETLKAYVFSGCELSRPIPDDVTIMSLMRVNL